MSRADRFRQAGELAAQNLLAEAQLKSNATSRCKPRRCRRVAGGHR
jgi:hypothetical protein